QHLGDGGVERTARAGARPGAADRRRPVARLPKRLGIPRSSTRAAKQMIPNKQMLRADRWLLACLLAAAMCGCSRQREPLPADSAANDTSGAVKVTAEPVSFRPVQRIVGVVGTLHGYEEISLGVKVEGRVRKIAHDVADRVRPGETLLEIDPTDYQLNVRQAQKALQVELAKLGLNEVPAAKVDVTHIPTVVQAQL